MTFRGGVCYVKAKMIIPVIVVSMLVFAVLSADAADKTMFYPNAKALGMGNTRIAGGFRYNGFIDNPALLARVPHIRFGIPLQFTINKNFLDVGNFVNDNQEEFQNFGADQYDEYGNENPDYMSPEDKQAFLKKVGKEDGKWSRLMLSPKVDLAISAFGHHVGLAVFSVTDVGFKVDRGIYEPRVWGEGTGRFAAVLGYAHQFDIIYPGLTLGMNVKYLQRRYASLFQIAASDLGNISDTMSPVEDELSNHEESVVAFDSGGLLELPVIDSEVGFVFNSLGDGRGASVDLGIAKQFNNNRLTLLADYIDFLDNNKENVFNKIHFGAEYKYLLLALRAGINRGYPVCGFGLNTKIIDIDYAYFTSELSNTPGLSEDPRHIVQIKFGW